MKVRVVAETITTDSAGNTVESIPVYDSEVAVGGIEPVALLETDDGVPIRIVAELAVENSAGTLVDAMIGYIAAPPVAPLQVIGTKVGVPGGGEGDGLVGDLTHQAGTSRHRFDLPNYDVLLEEVHFANWRINHSGNGEVNGPNSITVKHAIEPEGGEDIPTSVSAVRSVAIAAGDTAIFVPDAPILLDQRSNPMSRQFVSVGVAGQQWPVNRIAHISALGESDNVFGTGAGTDLVDATGTFGSGTVAYSFGPAAILGRPADGYRRPSVMIVGDSLQGPSGGDGAPSYGDAKGNYGYLERWIDNRVATLNCSRSGGRMSWFAAGHAKTFAYLEYCSSLIIALGANDWSTGRTAAQMLTDLATLITDARVVNPGLKIGVCTSTPKVTATTEAEREAGGTAAASGNNHRETYNETIRDAAERAARGIDFYLDPAIKVEDNTVGQRIGFFQRSVPALISDTTHLSVTGMQLAIEDFGDPEQVLSL